MAANDILYGLYSRLYAQRSVLSTAPQLTVDITQYNVQNFPVTLVEKESAAIVSYLCSVKDINTCEVKDILRIVQQNYNDQPFWKDIILDYMEYKLKQQEETIYKRNVELLKETTRVLNEIRQEENRRKELVRTFGDQINAQHFHIDAYKLMSCYFIMYRKDAKKAYDTLISNPAYFSPIITTDSSGHSILTPEAAKEENAKIAKFLKGLKI